jgi:hypothetical protein
VSVAAGLAGTARFRGLLILLLVTLEAPACGQSTVAAQKWNIDRSLTVTPQTAPIPALRFRFFPLSVDRKPGNAAPIYLRLPHERSDASRREVDQKTTQWLELPLNQFPLVDAKDLLSRNSYLLKQMDLAARRKECNWEYTLDGGPLFEMLLPDVHGMRMLARLLLVQARVQILEGDLSGAIHTLQSAFSFNQQIAEGPFLINGLVGVAGVNQATDVILDLLERPEAPNLYWALTALPRPLLDPRKALELEQRGVEMQFADLAEVERHRSPEEWAAALKRVREGIKKLEQHATGEANKGDAPAPVSVPDANAKKYLIDVAGLNAKEVEAMSSAQLQLLVLSGQNSEFRDDFFKASYLPYLQARPLLAAADKRLQEAPATEGTRLARLTLPALKKLTHAHTRAERKIAVLRVLEALRLHAAAHDGQLPDKLEQITAVPVPSDPMTGQPFAYERNGPTATLTSRVPGEPLEMSGVRLSVTIRK